MRPHFQNNDINDDNHHNNQNNKYTKPYTIIWAYPFCAFGLGHTGIEKEGTYDFHLFLHRFRCLLYDFECAHLFDAKCAHLHDYDCAHVHDFEFGRNFECADFIEYHDFPEFPGTPDFCQMCLFFRFSYLSGDPRYCQFFQKSHVFFDNVKFWNSSVTTQQKNLG